MSFFKGPLIKITLLIVVFTALSGCMNYSFSEDSQRRIAELTKEEALLRFEKYLKSSSEADGVCLGSKQFEGYIHKPIKDIDTNKITLRTVEYRHCKTEYRSLGNVIEGTKSCNVVPSIKELALEKSRLIVYKIGAFPNPCSKREGAQALHFSNSNNGEYVGFMLQIEKKRLEDFLIVLKALNETVKIREVY